MEFTLSRKLRFIAEPAFNRIFLAGKSSIGLSLDLGFQYKKYYYGIDYDWNYDGSRGLSMFGGSAFKLKYCFNYKDVFLLSPGLMAGFWSTKCRKPAVNNVIYHEDWATDLFFGGLCTKACVGYKWIYFQFDYSILFGTSVLNQIKFGLSFRI